MDFNNLTAGVNLDDAGQEGQATGGGGAKFSRAVPSGWYEVCFNRFGALGRITKQEYVAKDKYELRTTDVLRLGFEIVSLVKPLNPEDADFNVIKEFKNDDGTVDQVPYDVDINGMSGIKRSHHVSAQMPKVISALQEALPNDVYAKAVETHGTVQARYPTLKSMFGQHFIVYIQRFEHKGTDRNEVLFGEKKAGEFTALNAKSGTPKTVPIGMEVYSIDEGKPKLGISPVKKGKALHSKAMLFDIGARDMNQQNFDSVAQETIYVGKDAGYAGHGEMMRYCSLVDIYSRTGKYSNTAFMDLLNNKTIVIPEPEPYKERTKEASNKEEYSEPVSDSPIAQVAVTESAGDEEFQM